MYISFRFSTNPRFGKGSLICFERQICFMNWQNRQLHGWGFGQANFFAYYLKIRSIHQWDQCNSMKTDFCSAGGPCSAPPGIRCSCMSDAEILAPCSLSKTHKKQLSAKPHWKALFTEQMQAVSSASSNGHKKELFLCLGEQGIQSTASFSPHQKRHRYHFPQSHCFWDLAKQVPWFSGMINALNPLG